MLPGIGKLTIGVSHTFCSRQANMPLKVKLESY
jgi:hypothetical protein